MMMIIKIAGRSGSGKSQIANFLQSRLADQSLRVAVVDHVLFEGSNLYKQKLDNILAKALSDQDHDVLIMTITTPSAFAIQIDSNSVSHPALNIFAALGGPEWWSNK